MALKLVMTAAELAEALRTADEPSREIDDRIWRWVNENKLCDGWQYDLKPAPFYMTSLDAACTLLPKIDGGIDGPYNEYMDYILEHVNGGLTIGARVGSGDPDDTVFGCTAAAALSRAAIVAHIRKGSQ